MMIFKSFTVAIDYNLSVFWSTKKTFEGICSALAGKILQKELWIFLYLKPFCKEPLNLCLSLLMKMPAK